MSNVHSRFEIAQNQLVVFLVGEGFPVDHKLEESGAAARVDVFADAEVLLHIVDVAKLAGVAGQHTNTLLPVKVEVWNHHFAHFQQPAFVCLL